MIISTTSSRKTWAERQDEDEVENAKGIPARLTGYVFFILKNIYFATYYNYYSVAGKLAAQGTSVAPPERSARLQKASVLPPAPTISSSRARIDREPEITAKAVASHEDEDSSDSSENTESDSSAKHSDASGNSGSLTWYLYSTVLLMTVWMIFQIHEVDHYVICIIYNMQLSVLCVTVQITELRIHLHVKHTSQNGINTENTALVMFNQEFVECCKGLENLKFGIHKEEDQIDGAMIIMMMRNLLHLPTFLVQPDITV